ncbi:MAG TPA: GMC family oxidoreductase [Solirubrobacteraceae bacterium]|nr:GMC family oxidoreductase [Solirubrobacteraceae bacterium]
MTTSGPYDVVIVGSGAGGGVAAYALTSAGLNVLVLEKGPWATEADFGDDELRFGYRSFIDEDPLIEPRTFRDSAAEGDHTYVGTVLGASRLVGGGSVHYGAVCFRFRPEDFRALSTYGSLPGAEIADWPLTDAELDPSNPSSIWAYYRKVEALIGVAGGQLAGAASPGAPIPGTGQERTDTYPMPGHPANYPAGLFERAATKVGLHPFPNPVAVNNGSYDGRPGCSYCGFCSGYACPIRAKGDTRVTALAKALATGKLTISADTMVTGIEVDPGSGRATGVNYIDSNGNESSVSASVIVLAASTVDTPRLVLLSIKRGTMPAKMVNTDVVGHHLMTHHFPGAIGWFEDRIDPWRGYWSMRCLDDWYFGPPGTRSFGYGNIQNIGPSGGDKSVAGTGGMINMAKTVGWGQQHKTTMNYLFGHLFFLSMIGQDPPVPTNTVDLDPTVTDVYGLPVARITYSHHANDDVVQAAVVPTMLEIIEQMGATVAIGVPTALPEGGAGPLAAQGVGQQTLHRLAARGVPDTIGGLVNHQMGTMRMGTSADSSALDPTGRFWDIPNLYVADGSVFPTSGGYNPTLTIQAMAWRTADNIIAGGHA